MLTSQQALDRILSSVPPRRTARVPLAESLGLVCARDIVADIEMPRFDRAMMDGYALRSADAAKTPVELDVVETVHAGEVARETVRPGHAIRIMTGAPVPSGADAVLQHEQTASLDGGRRVRIETAVRPRQNIASRGEDLKLGEVVIRAGTLMRAAEIGLAATVGAATIDVICPPRVAVLATGDELVGVEDRPEGGQIRESNTWSLWAQLAGCGIRAERLGVARDTREDLDAKVVAGLAGADCLMLSGGVSAGEADYVIESLKSAGVEEVFHKVAIKPGAPLFFGRRGDSIVFGFPGNPVATFVCFEIFARPLLAEWSGNSGLVRPVVEASVGRAVTKAVPREQFIPSVAAFDTATGWTAMPVEWHGSGDLRGLARANALAVVPAGEVRAAGDRVRCVLLDGAGMGH